jgi:hypothetical protein
MEWNGMEQNGKEQKRKEKIQKNTNLKTSSIFNKMMENVNIEGLSGGRVEDDKVVVVQRWGDVLVPIIATIASFWIFTGSESEQNYWVKTAVFSFNVTAASLLVNFLKSCLWLRYRNNSPDPKRARIKVWIVIIAFVFSGIVGWLTAVPTPDQCNCQNSDPSSDQPQVVSEPSSHEGQVGWIDVFASIGFWSSIILVAANTFRSAVWLIDRCRRRRLDKSTSVDQNQMHIMSK